MDQPHEGQEAFEQVRRERDMLRQVVLALTRKPVSFTPEELAEMEANPTSFTELIDQLEARHPKAS
jgi:hypothetical protein